MWSFGAVLFHILCGQPAYTGRADDRGAQMLRNIMTNDAEYSMLTNSGVSEEGVDFVGKLLNRSPAARPKESECFQHPWLVNVPDEFNYMEIDGAVIGGVDADLVAVEEEDEEEDLDASALEINDEDDEYVDAQDDAQQNASSPEPVSVKRQRVCEEPDSDQQVVMVQQPSDEVRYPSLPNLESYDTNNPSVREEFNPSGSRLFGEIPQAALQSSGALGARLGENSMDLPEFQEPHRQDASFSDLSSSIDFPSDFALSPDAANQTHDNLLSARPSKFGMTDPSLMGAESLVNQLHVESCNGPRAPSTDPNSDNPTTPEQETEASQTGRITEKSGTRDHRKGSGRSEETPRGKESSRRTELAPHPSLDNQASNGTYETVGGENAGSSSKDYSGQQSGCENTQGSELQGAGADELARTIDERTGEEVDLFHTPVAEPQKENRAPPSITEHNNGEGTNTFTKPPPLLGKLTSLPGSISDQPIRLESRLTSWGRGTNATVRHHDPMDSRIPVYALELTFWAPSIESRIAAGQNWTQMPDIVTIISTKTRRRIWVNDVELRSESASGDAYLFGKVYTGDVITVYRDRERFLRFKCEFYHGRSVKTRAEAGENKFVVEKTAKTRSESVSTSSKITNNTTTTIPPTVATTMTTTGLGRTGSDAENKSPVEAQRRANSVM